MKTYQSLGKKITTSLVTGLAALVGCGTLSLKPTYFPKEGEPNTLTYVENGKKVTVYDLSGRWEAEYPTNKEIVRIEQNKNRFIGYKTIGDVHVVAGEATIRGYINGNFIQCDVFHSSKGWQGRFNIISKNGNSFICHGEEEREYKRIK